jgi:lipid-A-disaccharide synthase
VSAPTILISAGEPSGDRHAARFLREFKKAHPGSAAFGLGGPELRAEGLECVARMEDLTVVGLGEVISRLPAAFAALGRLEREARRRRPALVVPVDFPDFNLRLTARARRPALPVLYYISPQVWAWREGRVKEIRARVSRMGVVFPFEEEFYRERGFRADFVGHPLMEEIQFARPEPHLIRREWKLPESAPLVALFPGSRPGEVRRHWPLLLATAAEVLRRRPETQFAAALAPGLRPGELRVPAGLPVRVLAGAEHALFASADAAAVAAGTATLEALLLGCPSVVFYRTSGLTYEIMRRSARVTRVALANLIAGEDVMKERVQSAATPQQLAGDLLELLESPGARAALAPIALRVRGELGSRHASQEMVRLAGEML